MRFATEITGTTLAGVLYLLSGIAIWLSYFGVYDLEFLVKSESLMPYLSVAFVALSYVLGRMIDPLVPFYFDKPAAFFETFVFHDRCSLRVTPAEIGYDTDQVFLLQNASDALGKQLGRDWDAAQLLRSLMPAFWIFGVCGFVWLRNTEAAACALPTLIVSLAIGVILLFGYRSRVKASRSFIRHSVKVITESSVPNVSEGPTPIENDGTD